MWQSESCFLTQRMGHSPQSFHRVFDFPHHHHFLVIKQNHHFLFSTALEVKAGGGPPVDPISGIKPRVNPSAVHRAARHGQRPWGSACCRRRRRRLACSTPTPGARQDRQKDVRLLPLSSLPTPRSTSFGDPDSNSAFLVLVEMGGNTNVKRRTGHLHCQSIISLQTRIIQLKSQHPQASVHSLMYPDQYYHIQGT
jgi:hypothetical protein